MTNKERYELHDWIAVNVIGWHEHDPRLNSFNPTSSGKDAMDVLKKCAEKKMLGLAIDALGGWVEIWCLTDPSIKEKEETLELCACKIAKHLFSQTTK